LISRSPPCGGGRVGGEPVLAGRRQRHGARTLRRRVPGHPALTPLPQLQPHLPRGDVLQAVEAAVGPRQLFNRAEPAAGTAVAEDHLEPSSGRKEGGKSLKVKPKSGFASIQMRCMRSARTGSSDISLSWMSTLVALAVTASADLAWIVRFPGKANASLQQSVFGSRSDDSGESSN
jgi:hypothetical protein